MYTYGYQVKLSYVRQKILNKMNFVSIFIILLDQQLVSSLYIELTVPDSTLT